MKNEEYLQLVNEIKQGDKRAESKLYNNLYPFINLMCYKLVNNKEDAEDLAHEILVKIFKLIETDKSKRNFLSWASLITRNHCLNFIRLVSYKNLQLTENDDNLSYLLKDDNLTYLLKDDIFDENINERFGSYDIQLCLNKLKPIEKKVIDLVYCQGYKIKELFDIFTDLNPRNIRMILWRARNKMKSNLLKLEKNKTNNQKLFS
jgi:RNA polymerase sigma factor (sigma-70 family)